jgi:ribosomal-protein-alanine N-acetyltransferase
VPAIAAIEREAFTDPWSARAFNDTLARPDAIFLVAELAGQLGGYAIGVVVADEAEVLNVAVERDARRRGLGQRLVTALLEELRARGARRAHLEVRASNLPAIGLYGCLGFRRIGRRSRYYVSPVEDAVTMVLDLGPPGATE